MTVPQFYVHEAKPGMALGFFAVTPAGIVHRLLHGREVREAPTGEFANVDAIASGYTRGTLRKAPSYPRCEIVTSVVIIGHGVLDRLTDPASYEMTVRNERAVRVSAVYYPDLRRYVVERSSFVLGNPNLHGGIGALPASSRSLARVAHAKLSNDEAHAFVDGTTPLMMQVPDDQIKARLLDVAREYNKAIFEKRRIAEEREREMARRAAESERELREREQREAEELRAKIARGDVSVLSDEQLRALVKSKRGGMKASAA